MWVTDGPGALGCGLPSTTTGSFSYSYYQRVLSSSATSISFSSVRCASTVCCAFIQCTDANDFGCYGISYSQAINRPPPTAEESARSLAAGIVVAIVIGALVVSCIAAFVVRRKYYSGAFDAQDLSWRPAPPLYPIMLTAANTHKTPRSYLQSKPPRTALTATPQS